MAGVNVRLIAAHLALIGVLGCAGSIPKIPDDPEACLAKADSYFQRGKLFEAQELYKGFLSRFPGHDRSDYAQFQLAESYFRNKEYPLAAAEHQVLMSNYGYSEYVDDALFQIGVCYWLESPRPERDQQKTEDALSRFEQFLQTFPSSPLVDGAKAYIEQIHKKLAEKAFDTGYFYYRRKKPQAALIYFDRIIADHPNNEFWARALYYKALILEENGQTEEAIRYFSRVLSYPHELAIKVEARDHLKALRP
jgi:outer membrane protein assembly factor BamD